MLQQEEDFVKVTETGTKSTLQKKSEFVLSSKFANG
jgi:hypothetical protein